MINWKNNSDFDLGSWFFQVVFVAFMMWFTYVVNPTYLYYIFGIWIICLVYRYLIRRGRTYKLSFLQILMIIFLSVGLLFSISPRLEIKEFQLWHPLWISTKVDHYDVDSFYQRTSRTGHPVAQVDYTFRIKDKEYLSKNNDGINYDGFIFQFKSEKELVANIKKYTIEALEKKDYVLLVNKENPLQNKLFMPTSWITFQYSTFFRMISLILIGISIPLLCYFLFVARDKSSSVFGKKKS